MQYKINGTDKNQYNIFSYVKTSFKELFHYVSVRMVQEVENSSRYHVDK